MISSIFEKEQACRWFAPRRTRMFVVALLLVTLPGLAIAQSGTDNGRPLKVMTRNVYEGTDFTEALGATTLTDFLNAVTVTWQNVRATNPPARMAAIAQEIADQEPDLVAIQEANLWQTGPSPAALTTEYDMAQLLLTNLQNLGQPYVAVKVVPQFDFVAPSSTGLYVRTVTRIAILARADALSDDLTLANAQGGLFTTNLQFAHPVLGTITIARGWASVDATLKDRQFRFVTAHPEAFYPPVEIAQVYELLGGPAATSLPVIMAADFNSDADNPADPTYASYQAMLAAGFVDTWTAAEGSLPGFTCCQLNSLTNADSLLSQRIDLVMARGPFAARADKVIGGKPDDRVLGLWPSDHAGLVSRMRVYVQ